MHRAAEQPQAPTAVRTDLGAIFVSLELSRSTWLVTSLSPGGGEKMSKHQVRGGDIAALLARFAELKAKALARTGKSFPLVVIQEAGLDGFWIHRALVGEGIESHVVDPASIAPSRRRWRAKTDRIDGEALVRALLAHKRGEPRVCAMVRVPTPEEEDRRRLCRELKSLIGERVRHVNRLKGLFFAQGIGDYEPRRSDRRERLDGLRTGDGRPLPEHLKALARRELDVIELLNAQIEEVKAGRDALLGRARHGIAAGTRGDAARAQGRRARLRRSALVGRVVPALRQSSASRRLRGLGADAVAERAGRPRAGRVEGRQSAAARGHRRDGVAVAQAPAGLGARTLVPRSGPPRRRAHEEGRGRGARQEAPGRALEVRDRRRGHRGCRDEERLTRPRSPDAAFR